ncbi:MAG: response regulator [Candidatus Gastranaerophilales bacterium]|nr:response regulator [Candidatus Gastranaerophilales bacterium]
MEIAKLKKIMYAEDEDDIKTIVKVAIDAMSPCEIEFADNGQILLDTIDNYAPDLVLLDVMMPLMDGPTTLQKLRQKESTKNVPVIFMTAKAQVHELESLKKLGILGIITKPFDPVQLYANISKIWEEG